MESIMGQTLTDWELIVCESYSDDGTWEYLQQYADDARVKMHRVPRAGLYAGWNECLRRACGEYIYVATADDTMTPDCLEKLAGALESASDQSTAQSPESLQPALRSSKSEEGSSVFSLSAVASSEKADPRSAPRATPAEIAVCDFDFIDEQGQVIESGRRTPGDFYGDWMRRFHFRPAAHELLVHVCLSVSWTTMTAALFRRHLLERTGLFPEDCGPHGDKVWAIKTALYSDTVYYPECLATWRRHAEQGSSQRDVKGWKRAITQVERLLSDNMECLPPTLRNDPECLDKLMTAFRSQYLSGYGLTRATLRNAPARFLFGFARALIHEPRFAFHRLVRGFSWNDPRLVDDAAYLQRLLQEWKIP